LLAATMSLRVKKKIETSQKQSTFSASTNSNCPECKLKRGSFYRAKYNKLRYRLGSANKAKVAIANRIARSIYKILAGDKYKEIGYMRGDPHEMKI